MTYNKLWLPIKVAFVSAIFCGAAQAVTLSATAVDLPDVVAGQDLWQIDYSLAGPLAQFTGVNLIYPFADFDTLTVVTEPSSELDYALTPAPSSADALLTLTALSDLTPVYTTNFSVSFTKLTANALGPQAYELFDDTFAVIDTGSITIGSPSPVPEPSKAALLLLGAFAVAGAQWRRSRAV